MIAKAKAISHGINGIRYITGESHNKKHPEKIHRIMDNLFPSHLDAMGIWNAMQLSLCGYNNMKNSVIRIELSPSAEHTRFFTPEDWKALWLEFIAEFDKQKIQDSKGKVISNQTNLMNSKHTVWLHTESNGGVPHLHGAVCRVDEDGNINNDHHIHLRAQRAAEQVAIRRGWITAAQVRTANIHQVNNDCMEVIKSMSSWSWEDYKAALIRKGYSVHERRDKDNCLRGYTLQKGNARYKASELGVARNLMVTKLQRTWEKEHIGNNKANITSRINEAPRRMHNYTMYHPTAIPYTVTHNDTNHKFYIPEKIMDFFDDEFDYRFISNHQELTDMAVSIFVGLLAAQEANVGSGGGGSQSDLPWRDKDDDDMKWARKCALAASRSLGKKPKTGYRR